MKKLRNRNKCCRHYEIGVGTYMFKSVVMHFFYFYKSPTYKQGRIKVLIDLGLDSSQRLIFFLFIASSTIKINLKIYTKYLLTAKTHSNACSLDFRKQNFSQHQRSLSFSTFCFQCRVKLRNLSFSGHR